MNARENGRSVVVATEYHQPLAKRPLDEIFHLSEPLKPFNCFVEQSKRYDLRTFKPRWYPHKSDEARGLWLIESQDLHKSLSSWVPEEPCGLVECTTGQHRPGSPNARRAHLDKKESRFASQLAALESLSLRGRFRDAVAARAEELTRPFLGVHFRNTDRTSSLEIVVSKVQETIKEKGISDIYWCTDDKSSIEEARARLPNSRVFSSQTFETGQRKNLHNGLRGNDSIKHLEHTFADLYTLSVANEFIPSVGGWRQLVPILRNKRTVSHHFFAL
jgi:hypothetical protein